MNKQGLVLGWLAVTLLVMLVGVAVRNTQFPFSQYQPLSRMQDEYIKCKENAPQGFDCYMQPVMVSEPFIIEQTK